MKKSMSVIVFMALGACSLDPRAYESTPVTVDTAAGPVQCQLYTDSIQAWDRAISRPGTMSVQAADQICLNEGYRRKNGGGGTAADTEL